MEQKNKSILLSAVYTYLLVIVFSLITLPFFKNFYDMQFKPVKFDSMFSFWGYKFDITLNSFIFASIFFLPLFVQILVSKKQWLVWLIGIIIPFAMVLVGGSKHIFWFVIFTIAGGIIGWLIKLAIKKFKKI